MGQLKTIEYSPDGLRRGYTTGTCATAAAKAAALMLIQGKPLDKVDILTPGGTALTLEVKDQQFGESMASCGVVKDSGDDPDITNGITIYAKVQQTITAGITIKGGEGIGIVTKPGLQVAVGEPAINPVPLQMITQAVAQIWPAARGIEVTISAPQGKHLARKTFNPRLGIVGGISILGTTGIVEPRSADAYKVSLALALNMALAAGEKNLVLVLVPGNLGEGFARRHYVLGPQEVVHMGNQVGFMLDECRKKGVTQVILLGHIGKLVKVAAGIFDTSSRIADARLETIAYYAKQLGANQELINQLHKLSLAEAAIPLLKQAGLAEVFNIIAQAVTKQATKHVAGKVQIGCQLYSLTGELLGQDNVACMWSKEKCRTKSI